MLPDVVCDFSTVELQQTGTDQVLVTGAKGRAAPDTYKVSATYADQFRGGTSMSFYGFDADKKANALAEAIFRASRRVFDSWGLADFSETSVELIGAESQYGNFSQLQGCREVAMKIAVKHADAMAIGIFLKEAVGLGLATPPGLSGFQGGRPKPSPVVSLFSFALPKDKVEIQLDIDGEIHSCNDSVGERFDINTLERPQAPADVVAATVEVPLIKLAWGRSGDKGDKANIGIIARKPEYLPYIYAALTEQVVTERFAHFLSDTSAGNVERFLMPGSSAINFLLHSVLGGGGVASIRNDPQGKGYAQLLLATPVAVPEQIAASVS